MKLQTKLILISCSLIFLVVLILAVLFQTMFVNTIKDQIGQRALSVANTVSSNPLVIEAFEEENPSQKIQPYAEEIRKKTGAQYVVVGNKAGIRYSHPLSDRIGKKMVGGDNDFALAGETSITEATGSLGPAVRGKAPIMDSEGEVIGLVSVGFLTTSINEIIWPYKLKILLFGILTLLLGIVGSVLIANGVKKATHGLEPKEIGLLYKEKSAILEAIREGVIAINREGHITIANHTALQMLGRDRDDLTGRNILEAIPNTRLLDVIATGKSEFDEQMKLGNSHVVANRVPISDDKGEVIGAVATFRNKNELYRLNEELAQVKGYSEGLRAQTHEFSNKLYLISGLIQLGSYQEALDVISKESDNHQSFGKFIMSRISDPYIGGLLIGKFNRSIERKVPFLMDRSSQFKDIPEAIDRQLLVTIIGNLVDNAMDAAVKNSESENGVQIYLSDMGNQLLIEVEDYGEGISSSIANKLYQKGFSTKGSDRGYGLYLVYQSVKQLNGEIFYERTKVGSTLFTVMIPKE
ncbi:ATP-binding protein [Fictibacillus phosphorivorans]|uniref:ATP-binding protein n=1 Tax=Fictibacillus phosphorivorans TaxID=1221500 RepID=UPI00203CAE14|nr:sensor histidine kinase [Fictibacillus phosphorivorans]MCM3719367.1 sensor histidine kinase [Fictibacillus phosphorivorans]MCM3776988.1 sensor histidine kinase [Fictibacillus phosphorivorans]